MALQYETISVVNGLNFYCPVVGTSSDTPDKTDAATNAAEALASIEVVLVESKFVANAVLKVLTLKKAESPKLITFVPLPTGNEVIAPQPVEASEILLAETQVSSEPP